MLRDDQEVCRYCRGNKRILSPDTKNVSLDLSVRPNPEIRLHEHYVTCPYCGGLGWRLVGVER